MAEIDACTFAIMREKGIVKGREDLAAVQLLKQTRDRLLIDFLTESSPHRVSDESTVDGIADEICKQAVPDPKEFLERMGVSPLQIAKQRAGSQLEALGDSLSERENPLPKIHYHPELSMDDFIRELLCQNKTQPES